MCVCARLCACIYAFVHACTCAHIFGLVHVFGWVDVCVHACRRAFAHSRMFAGGRARDKRVTPHKSVDSNARVPVCLHVRGLQALVPSEQMSAHEYVSMVPAGFQGQRPPRSGTNQPVHMHACAYVCVYACVCVWVHVCKCTCVNRVCGGITRTVKTQFTRIATNSAGGLSCNNSGYMWDNSTVYG